MLRSTWLRRLILATVVPLILVETVLQLGALAVAILAPSRAAAPAGGCAVLCVGDSYTFGLGASSTEFSYPAALESILSRDPIDGGSRVVNAGWPGRNSRDVVGLFAQQMAQFRPRRVAILIGVNDVWTRPARVDLREPDGAAASNAGDSRFRLEWRLPRLVALLLQPRAAKVQEAARVVHAPEPAAQPPPTAPAPVAPPPTASAPAAPLASPSPSAPPPAAAAKKKDRAAVAPPNSNELAWHALDAGDFAGAESIVRTWLEREPDSPWAKLLLVELGVRTGRPEMVAAALAELKALADAARESGAAEAYVQSLAIANRVTEAGAIARQELARWPKSFRLWTVLANAADVARDDATVDDAVEHAIALDPRKDPWPLASNLRLRSRRRLAREDRRGAARDALAAFAADGSENELRLALTRASMHCEPELVDALGAEVGLAGAKLERARAIAAETLGGDHGDAAPVLEDHLRQLVECARRHGAEPVLLTYPFGCEVVERSVREVAATAKVRVANVTRRFDELLKTVPREQLFVPDGHCNDRGYRVVAEEVAAALHSR